MNGTARRITRTSIAGTGCARADAGAGEVAVATLVPVALLKAETNKAPAELTTGARVPG